MTYPSGHDETVGAGGTDDSGVTLSSRNHPAEGPGVKYSTPSEYYGPDVPTQAALVNPSAGNQGPVESGMTDINPQGPAPHAGTGPSSNGQVYPDTTQG